MSKNSFRTDLMYFATALPDAPGAAFAELAMVELTEPAVNVDGDPIPAGSIGTVVGVLGEAGYDVEFAEPLGMAAVRGEALKAAA